MLMASAASSFTPSPVTFTQAEVSEQPLAFETITANTPLAAGEYVCEVSPATAAPVVQSIHW